MKLTFKPSLLLSVSLIALSYRQVSAQDLIQEEALPPAEIEMSESLSDIGTDSRDDSTSASVIDQLVEQEFGSGALDEDQPEVERSSVVFEEETLPETAAEEVYGTAGGEALTGDPALESHLDQDIEGVSSDERLALLDIYQSRNFAPYFSANAAAQTALEEAIAEASTQGLPASRYEMPDAMGDEALAEIYQAATLLRYAHDMERGLVAPRSLGKEFDFDTNGRSYVEIFNAFESAPDKAAFFVSLEPNDPAYPLLKQELAGIHKVMGEGIAEPILVPEGETLRMGDNHARVVALRGRLEQLGFSLERPEIIGSATVATADAEADMILDELAGEASEPEMVVEEMAEEVIEPELVEIVETTPEDFDANVDYAVKEFQKAAGITVDGIVGPGTVRALNQGPEDRLKSVLIAMERHRWASPERSGRHIYVNIANFMAEVRDDNEKVFETRVVVGKNKSTHRTPEFHDEMTHLIVNPKWNVPSSISVREYLPIIQRDPGYLARNNITMRIKGSGQVVSPTQIDMSQFTVNDFPFLLQQQSGDGNALGNVKFMFPNSHNIYLHDTPSRSLFSRSKRTFSHGCVRVGDPEDLATLLMAPQVSNPRETYRGYVASGKERQVNLEQPVAVHLTYFTAYPNDNGGISYAEDSYGRDALLADALRAKGVDL